MIAAMQTALAGMQAATGQLNIAAENIVNAQSTGKNPGEAYHAQQAVQYTNAFGAPVVYAREKEPPTLELYAPSLSAANEDGIVEFPNVSLAEEIVNLKMAELSYKASALVMMTAADMLDELINRPGRHHNHHA